jgi:MFS family permease
MALVSVSLYCFIANISSASLASALTFLATDFDPPVPEGNLSHLIAVCILLLFPTKIISLILPQVNVLMFGAANIWWVPLSNVFGRRPIILINLLILVGCSVWTAKASTFNSLLAARVFQGIGGAASDTLCPGVIGEIYFRHQRGRSMVRKPPFPLVSS